VKDNKSLLLALLAIGLIITWGYHLYDKSQYSNKPKEVLVKDPTIVAKAVSDSLREFFTHTLNQLGNEKIETDSANSSLNEDMKQKINEIDTLKNEIGTILKRSILTQADLTEAQLKIDSLKRKLTAIKNEDKTLAEQSNKVDGIESRLSNETNSQQQHNTKIKDEKRTVAKVDAIPVFTASSIKFAAYSQLSENETETTSQETAKKFIASFTVKNNSINEKNAEIIVVVTDPSGKSINPEVWDAGSFETKYEGRKVYTKRIRFEYNKGEVKRLNLTLEPENFVKGTYKLSLYNNGVRIGETSWKLS
jgi:hypothetical protein